MIEENRGVIGGERLHVEGADLVAEGLQAPGHVDHRGEQVVAQVNVALGEHQVLITSLIEVPEAEIHFVGAKNGAGREGCRILSMSSGVVARRAHLIFWTLAGTTEGRPLKLLGKVATKSE